MAGATCQLHGERGKGRLPNERGESSAHSRATISAGTDGEGKGKGFAMNIGSIGRRSLQGGAGTVLLLAVLAGCDGSTGGGAPSLDGTWLYTDSTGAIGQTVTYNGDGTYTFQVLELTSTTTADVEIENGTYTTSGGVITTTPAEWTCPGSDPVDSCSFEVQGESLIVSAPTGAIVYQRTSPTQPSDIAITFGCFLGDGTFAPSPLGPVNN